MRFNKHIRKNKLILWFCYNEKAFFNCNDCLIINKLIADAKEQASEEARKLVTAARESIQAEKKAAVSELKSQVANLSLDIAEKILKKKLEESKAQKELINKLISEADLN